MPFTQANLIRAGLIAACLTIIAASSANAADQARSDTSNPERPSTRVVKIAANEAPVVDGGLSDPVWQKATVIERFTQTEPSVGSPVSERTVARIVYDENNLYIGVYAYDMTPDQIVAAVNARDGNIERDDSIQIYLDPHSTRRDGYIFGLNPLSARSDALLQNNRDKMGNWDTIWEGRSQITSDGWTAEMRIPFRSLAFDPQQTTWGFDILRNIKHKAETARWGAAPAGTFANDITFEGSLTDLTGAAQGAGLDIQIYGQVSYKHQSRGQDDNDLQFRPSTNIYYKVTPSLTGALTVNTDFSDAPLDARRVNTTRFSLFTDETREFFLQDAPSFAFGGRSFDFMEENGRPFFSRNIGLVRGLPTPINVGLKFSGTLGDIGIGALTVLTEGTDTTDGQVLSVVRLTAPVLSESRIGVIFTEGDPTGATDNALSGADFQYSDSRLFGSSDRLTADFYFMRSFSSLRGDDNAYGASILFPNEPLYLEARFKQLGENFEPSLGFANRVGIREIDGRFRYRERFQGSYLRWFDTGLRRQETTDLNGRMQSWMIRTPTNFFTTDNDNLLITYARDYEKLDAPFVLPGGVTIPAGEYEWQHYFSRLTTSDAREIAIELENDCCSYFNGDYYRGTLRLDWRPDETWFFHIEHSATLIDLPTGSVNIHVTSVDASINFTPDMYLNTQIQYDNISKRFALLSRYRWEYEPGSELFVALGENGLLQGPFLTPHYKSDNTRFLVRLGNTIQF